MKMLKEFLEDQDGVGVVEIICGTLYANQFSR